MTWWDEGDGDFPVVELRVDDDTAVSVDHFLYLLSSCLDSLPGDQTIAAAFLGVHRLDTVGERNGFTS